MSIIPQKIITNETPKERFQNSGLSVGNHRNIVDNADFQKACDFALLEYSHKLALNASQAPDRSGINGLKLAGAHEFLAEFRNLSEKAQALPTAPPMPQLNHRA